MKNITNDSKYTREINGGGIGGFMLANIAWWLVSKALENAWNNY